MRQRLAEMSERSLEEDDTLLQRFADRRGVGMYVQLLINNTDVIAYGVDRDIRPVCGGLVAGPVSQ